MKSIINVNIQFGILVRPGCWIWSTALQLKTCLQVIQSSLSCRFSQAREKFEVLVKIMAGERKFKST